MSAVTVAPRPIRTAARPARGVFVQRRPVRPTVRRQRAVYLRRRIAAVLTIVAVALAISGLWAMRSNAASDAGLEATVVVAPGETVWDIALDYLPEGQRPQVYVAQILRHNDVDPAAVVPGAVLQLPRP